MRKIHILLKTLRQVLQFSCIKLNITLENSDTTFRQLFIKPLLRENLARRTEEIRRGEGGRG